MKSSRGISILAAMILFLAVAPCMAGGHGAATTAKTGILLVAFGTSEPAAQAAFDHIDQRVRAAFPNVPVRWAYTSHIIREKLAKQGKHLDSPMAALARMADEKFTHVAVQSLHTIGGEEFHDLQRVVMGYQAMGVFQQLRVGDPLMSTQADMQRIVDAVVATLPKERQKKEAVVLMGHGTHHPANAFYAALMFQLQLRDPNIFVGTVEGYPEIGLVKEQLLARKIKRAYLMPFMAVAGDHARNDMAGDEEDSWKTILTRAGIKCVPVLKGTAESDAFADIWVGHLGEVLKHFG